MRALSTGAVAYDRFFGYQLAALGAQEFYDRRYNY
jgi:hypothetical protein